MMNKQAVARNIVKYFTENARQGSTLSPFCQRILGTVAQEINSMDWLVDAAQHRTPLETSLLLMAGMHRQVLLGTPEVTDLRDYYQSVGGEKDSRDASFSKVFLESLDQCKEQLDPIIQTETIQTNETQRGLFWLLPAILSGWKQLHVVDLGASAGLNLVADQRRFTCSDDNGVGISFGLGKDLQFQTYMTPVIPDKLVVQNNHNPVPLILSRNGCDLHPFPLVTDADRAKLESFVWPDQVQRFRRLQEGIDAHKVTSQEQSINIAQVDLPHGLEQFLESLDFSNDQEDAPVLIYNTYMTTYLENEGRDLKRYIERWSAAQNRHVMWVQSEPLLSDEQAPTSLKHHWCAWTVDLWDKNGNAHRHWHLAWTHPHGTEMELLPGLDRFMEDMNND